MKQIWYTRRSEKYWAISAAKTLEGQFLILLFLVGKIDWVSRPVISLKEMNKKVPYAHFQMKGLLLLKQLLLPGDFMFKINLKETYFALSLSNNSQKCVRFWWKGVVYEFLYQCLDFFQRCEFLLNKWKFQYLCTRHFL